MKMYKSLAFCLGLMMFAGGASAQSMKSLERDLSNLREDFEVMQRRIYQTGTAGANADNVVRIQQMEEQLRGFTGRMDELDYKIKKLEERIDMINKDVDVRIKMIEGKPIEGMSNQAAAPKKFDAPVAVGAPAAVTGAAVASAGELKPLENEELKAIYEKGLNELRATNYGVAEEAFTEILNKFPKDKLAGNAQYWLGEVYYGKKEYDKAAVAFAKGYQNYKDGAKGPDSLLKLGMSMNALGKKPEACAAFMTMENEFPKASDDVKAKAKDEAKKLSCK